MKRNIGYTERMKIIALFGLLQAGISRGAWTAVNLTVTRSVLAEDTFAFSSAQQGQNACGIMNQESCASFGGSPTNERCGSSGSCCKSCRCDLDRPTYVVHARQCVSNENLTTLRGSNESGCQFYLASGSSSSASCSNSTLPTLDITAPGRRRFAICKEHRITDEAKVLRCKLVPHESQYLDNGRWISLHDPSTRRAVKHGFTVNKLELQWRGMVDTSLRGLIVCLAIKCSVPGPFTMTGMVEIAVDSCVQFKAAGSRTWPGPRLKRPNLTTTTTPSNHSGAAVVMTTRKQVIPSSIMTLPLQPSDPSTSDTKKRLKVVQVVGDLGLLLIVLAAVLGSLLVIVLASMCFAIAVYRKKKKKGSISGRQRFNTNNPTYERGPDKTLMQYRDSRQASMYTNSPNFYQPLVENTRPIWASVGEPIYQSLDQQSRASKNSLAGSLVDARRLSLPFCDMTDDGYLVPADGHTHPTPPVSQTLASEGNITEETEISQASSSSETAPRISKNYDEPEIIIQAEAPDSDNEYYYEDMIEITLKIEEGVPFYYVLEGPGKGKSARKTKKRETREKSENSPGTGEQEANTLPLQTPRGEITKL